MPPNRQPKQRRTAISNDLKRQICEWSEANKNKKHHEIAEHFNEKYPNMTIDRRWNVVVNAEISNKTFRQAVFYL